MKMTLTFAQSEEVAKKLSIDLAHDCDDAAEECTCPQEKLDTDRVGDAHAPGDTRCATRADHSCCSHDIEELGDRVFSIRDEGCAMDGDPCCGYVLADDMDDAEAKATEWAEGGDWSDVGRGSISVYITALSGDERCITVDVGEDPAPPETDCGTADDDHDWQSPIELVGGIKENPGVWGGSGTSMSFSLICVQCGLRKKAFHRGSQRNPGEAAETVSYDGPDADDIQRLKDCGEWTSETDES